MVKRYYIELTYCVGEEPYILQSKWFNSKASAVRWYHTTIDMVSDGCSVYLMSANFDENDDYDDIVQEEKLD